MAIIRLETSPKASRNTEQPANRNNKYSKEKKGSYADLFLYIPKRDFYNTHHQVIDKKEPLYNNNVNLPFKNGKHM